jgi:hypothetical protein
MIKNTSGQAVSAQLVAVADGEDVTSGTTTIYVTGDAGTQASGGGTVTHEGNGCWSYQPTQAETNYDHVSYTFVNTAAISVTVQRDPITLADYKATGFSTHDAAAVVTALGTGSGLTSLATAAALATVDGIADAIKAKTDNLPSDPADQSLIIAATDAITSAIAALNDVSSADVNAACDTAISDASLATAAAIAENISVADILTAQMTESYAAKGAAPTLAQSLFWVQQVLTELSFSGTTGTVKKLDGSTTAGTLTLDNADDPTSLTRAT